MLLRDVELVGREGPKRRGGERNEGESDFGRATCRHFPSSGIILEVGQEDAELRGK